MKKLLLVFCLLVASSHIHAQPPSGLAPDFTLKDLNGNWHNLYSYLNQGKTVFIEFSAAWCQPCWNFHNSNVFETLYQQHGPSGLSGVNPNTTNDVMVFFIESEANNTTAQLYGITGSGSSQTTMGNWVAGTPFPILDTNATTTNALLNAWGITSFPTILMICRDRLAYKFSQQPASQLYSASSFICPSYPPSSSVDVKSLPYNDKDYFFCNPDPHIRFQNYSASNAITNASINILSNNTPIHTYNWTGNLQPYQIANVAVPGFAASPYSGYRFEVQVSGDTQPANNKSSDSLFWVYSAGNANSIPMNETFDNSPITPYKFKTSSYYVEPASGTVGTTPVIYVKDINGQNTRALRFHNRLMWWYETLDLVAGNYNTQGAGNLTLEFDVAYAQYNGNENDTLEVLISTDCGTNWNTAWLKSGSTLATRTPVGNFTDFYPQQVSHWRHESVNLNAYQDPNTVILFRTHCNMGNDIWIDNLKLQQTTSVREEKPEKTNMMIYPNPANEVVNLSLDLPFNTSGRLVVVNTAGRTMYEAKEVSLTKGKNSIVIPVMSFSEGVYYLAFTHRFGILASKFNILR